MAQATGVRSPHGHRPRGTRAGFAAVGPIGSATTNAAGSGDSKAAASTASAAARTGKTPRKVPLSSTVATKSLAFSEGIVWMAQLNAAWIAFTLLGGVVFGFAPATVAASALCRRRLRGAAGTAAPVDDTDADAPFLRAFWHAYRAEFWRANVVLLPVAIVCVLVASTLGFAVTGAPGIVVLPVCAVALVCAAVVAFLPTMYVHYELPTLRYASTASRFVLANPGPALLLLLTAGGITLLTTFLPALLVFFSIGAWIHASTALCLSFFASNDERMSALADRSSN